MRKTFWTGRRRRDRGSCSFIHWMCTTFTKSLFSTARKSVHRWSSLPLCSGWQKGNFSICWCISWGLKWEWNGWIWNGNSQAKCFCFILEQFISNFLITYSIKPHLFLITFFSTSNKLKTWHLLEFRKPKTVLQIFKSHQWNAGQIQIAKSRQTT